MNKRRHLSSPRKKRRKKDTAASFRKKKRIDEWIEKNLTVMEIQEDTGTKNTEDKENIPPKEMKTMLNNLANTNTRKKLCLEKVTSENIDDQSKTESDLQTEHSLCKSNILRNLLTLDVEESKSSTDVDTNDTNNADAEENIFDGGKNGIAGDVDINIERRTCQKDIPIDHAFYCKEQAFTKKEDSKEEEFRRIVDVKFFVEKILNERHGGGIDCSFMDMKLLREKRERLKTKFLFKCTMCKKEEWIEAIDPKPSVTPINKAAVNGAIAAGIGYAQVNQFFAAMDMPFMSHTSYALAEQLLGKELHEIAWDTIEKAGRIERDIAIANGRVDKDGVPWCAVVADGQWGKRSYGRNYNALSGSACILGFETKKVLFIAIRNKYCCICKRAENKGETAVQHTCYKNWTGSSTAMESDSICEGFSQSVQLHGMKFLQLIGDGDSSVTNRLRALKPYGPDSIIEKIECVNHLLRNLDKKIEKVTTNTAYPIKYRKHIEINKSRFRKAVKGASEYWRNADGDENDRVRSLHQDIINVPNHVFGNHQNCRDYFCKRKNAEADLTVDIKRDGKGLFEELGQAFQYLAMHSDSVIADKNNNMAEEFNSLAGHFLSHKGINYSQRGSYNTRIEAAVISFNDKEYLRTTTKALTGGVSPGGNTKKFLFSEERKRKDCRKRKLNFKDYKSSASNNRQDHNVGPDQHYGSVVNDVSEEELKKRMQAVLDRVNSSDVKKIEQETKDQASSKLWAQERSVRLTASNFGTIIKMRETTGVGCTVVSLLYKIAKGPALDHGKKFEPIAREKFEIQEKKSVLPAGLHICKNSKFLAATPDGIVKNENSIIEIKCVYTARNCQSLEEAISEGKCDYFGGKKTKPPYRLIKTHKYFYQIQGQLNIGDYDQCYFIVYGSEYKWLHVEIIQKDEDLWNNNMVQKLERFYLQALLPELAFPLYGINRSPKDIREAAYVLEAKKIINESTSKIKTKDEKKERKTKKTKGDKTKKNR